jgi:dTDP-glucose 4,6-dehydratase
MGKPIRFDDPVVVTGGAGFLGTEVVRQLHEAGCPDVRVVDLRAYAGASKGPVKSTVADIRSGAIQPAFEGARTVLHLAACQYHTPLAKSTYDLPFFSVNVGGTARVIDAATRAGVERLVFVSTNMVYGLPRSLPLAENRTRKPFGPYGQSKLAAERLVEEAHGPALSTAIVRPGLIVGPGRIGVVARVFDWILAGRPIWLIGDGRNHYELVASEDVARLVLHAAVDREFGAYNCGAKTVPTMREWIEAVTAEARSPSRIVGVPGRPVKAALRALEAAHASPLRMDQYLIADVDYYMDTARARQRLGWEPRWGGTDAVLATFRWYSRESPQRGEALVRAARATAREPAGVA